nr:serine/threonine-protein kinase CTR1-like isoform X1 [Ipomoea batatas]
MEMPKRRSNYALLSQIPDDNFHQLPKFTAPGAGVPTYESHSEPNRHAGYPTSIGLQRQSSDSSFGESSISGDYYMSSLSNPGGGGSLSTKSWAQQTEESYQLQLALALRLSSEATCDDDPHFLVHVLDEGASRSSASTASAESMPHRFGVSFIILLYGETFIQEAQPRLKNHCSNIVIKSSKSDIYIYIYIYDHHCQNTTVVRIG